jgi:hypothetical protein
MLKPTIARLLEIDVEGELPYYAWPGGYPIIYVDGWDEQLCPECANKAMREQNEDSFSEDLPTDWYIHYEGASKFCYECNTEIESAYSICRRK